MSTTSLKSLGICGLLVCAIAGGCGAREKLLEVTGTVTVNGQPAADLQVLFEPQDNGDKPSSVGHTLADGTYRLTTIRGEPGAVQGMHTVRVTADETDEGPPREIPARYNEASELTCDVSSQPTIYDIEIDTN